MKKNKAIILLSLVCIIMAFVMVMTFLRFSVGIYNYNSIIGTIETDYDVVGGVSYTLTLNKENDNEVEDVNDVMNILSVRLTELGYKAHSISAFKEAKDGVEDYSIRISVEKTDSVSNDIAAVAAYGSVKFFGGSEADPTNEIMTEEKVIEDAKFAGVNGSEEDGYLVAVQFTDYGYNELVSEIKANDSYYLKIMLGETVLLSGQISADAITEKTVYITSSSEAAAKQTAMQIRTGGLEYKYDISSSKDAAPLLGEKAAFKAGIAVAIVLAVIIIALIVLFGGYGIIGSLNMHAFAMIETAMFVAVPGIKLSMAGIFGAVIATLVCLDGIVMAIKKIREEYENGKTVKASVKTGYRRSLMAIVNSNVVVGIIALSLFAFTTGAIQSFAITLGIGVVVSIVTNVLFARMFMALVLPLAKNKESFLKISREAE